jgi:uncharacterized membrane protein (UPF0127 family)
VLRASKMWRLAAAICGVGITAAVFGHMTVDPSPRTVTVHIGTAAPLVARVADSPEERTKGLMGVRGLAPRRGMIFIFDRREPVAFWMYRTPVPLSLVFVDGRRVVGVQEMPPCGELQANRCPQYSSPSAVTHAVEAPAGFFTSAGVSVGDRMIISDGTTP